MRLVTCVLYDELPEPPAATLSRRLLLIAAPLRVWPCAAFGPVLRLGRSDAADHSQQWLDVQLIGNRCNPVCDSLQLSSGGTNAAIDLGWLFRTHAARLAVVLLGPARLASHLFHVDALAG